MRLLLGLGLLTGLALAPKALGSLGGSPESVDSDRAALSAQEGAAATRAHYSVRELVSPSAAVREYVSPSGTVFAVAWSGIAHPDLKPLLGSYYGEYADRHLATPRTPGQRHRRVEGENVVVEHWGHMRNLGGRAYLPALIPPGVTLDEIR